jgi:hypothetical protein
MLPMAIVVVVQNPHDLILCSQAIGSGKIFVARDV